MFESVCVPFDDSNLDFDFGAKTAIGIISITFLGFFNPFYASNHFQLVPKQLNYVFQIIHFQASYNINLNINHVFTCTSYYYKKKYFSNRIAIKFHKNCCAVKLKHYSWSWWLQQSIDRNSPGSTRMNWKSHNFAQFTGTIQF